MRQIIEWIPVMLIGCISFVYGIYQLVFKKESFLIKDLKKKYNYENHKTEFIKACGIIYVLLGIFAGVTVVVAGNLEVTLVEKIILIVPFILLIALGEHLMIKRYTNNLEEREK